MADDAAEEHRERELKFDIEPDWQLPDPSELIGPEGSVERLTAHLETTYFDTAERDLLRRGMTLRRRTGDLDAGWQLKVPEGDARTEVRFPLGSRAGVPAELRDATAGVRRGTRLQQLATLVTTREMHRLRDRDGSALAEIVIDAVTAMQTRDVGITRRWRELEVELVDGDEALLERASRWLVEHGAEPSRATSKLARAIDVERPKPRDTGTLAGLVERYLDEQADAIIRGDVDLRRGRDVVHPTRVATRRYRSVLRVLNPLFDPERAGALDAELAWFADGLGAVRDRQVLRTHLDEALAELPPELVMGPVAARLHQQLAAEEAEGAAQLAAQLGTQRYFALLGELQEWRERLPVASDEPARNVAGYLAKAERKLRRRIASAPQGAGRGEALHRARKQAKRTRYLAELAVPELGKRAHKLQKRTKKATQRLGVRQDRVVAAEFLRRMGALAGAAGENGFTYGLLYERELRRAGEIDG